MLFCSLQFLVFFVIVFSVYWALPWQRARVLLLLAASFYFYASWNHWLALLIGVSTALDYGIGLLLDSVRSQWKRKLLLGFSITANLGLLGYFKYANFFLHSLEDVLHGMGASSASMPVLSVMLPIGISFYTFEAINYTVDVYRKRVAAERNLFNFMLFVTFFPHLIAGPIVRARDFLPQIRRPKHFDWARFELGGQLFLLGLVKKLVVADRMALLTDPVFAGGKWYGSGALWLAMFAYAAQVYCDFSGYSDMALGAAHMLGYKLVRNFDLPYLAPNITDLWRRWHISLSTWLRDYLFFPLGGSRGPRWQTERNLLITMTVCGLWHGAKWNFVVFGAVQGLLLIAHRRFRMSCSGRPRLAQLLATNVGTCGRIGVTFLTFCLSLVIFRAETLSGAVSILKHLFFSFDGMPAPIAGESILVTLAGLFIAQVLAHRGVWKRWSVSLPPPALGFGYAGMLVLALLLAPVSGRAFIYFQF